MMDICFKMFETLMLFSLKTPEIPSSSKHLSPVPNAYQRGSTNYYFGLSWGPLNEWFSFRELYFTYLLIRKTKAIICKSFDTEEHLGQSKRTHKQDSIY